MKANQAKKVLFGLIWSHVFLLFQKMIYDEASNMMMKIEITW